MESGVHSMVRRWVYSRSGVFLRSRSFLAGLVLSSWEVHFVYCLGHTVHMENGGAARAEGGD